MSAPVEVLVSHSIAPDDPVTPQEIELVHELFADILFSEWLREKRFLNARSREVCHEAVL